MKKKCNYCDCVFETKDKRQKFCSRSCSNKNRANSKIAVDCTNCDKVIERYPSQVSKTPFCSRECNVEYMKREHSREINCSICGKAFRRKRSHFERSGRDYCSYQCSNKGFSIYYSGNNHPNFLNTHTNCSHCNKEIYRKRAVLLSHKVFFCSVDCERKWKSKNTRGENHPRYNPDMTEEERIKDRLIPEYYDWRLSVFERDNYTCQVCMDNRGGNLNAHHLNSYKWDVENRTNVNNGITLCEKCHIEYHSIYGRGNNTKREFKLYIDNKLKHSKP